MVPNYLILIIIIIIISLLLLAFIAIKPKVEPTKSDNVNRACVVQGEDHPERPQKEALFQVDVGRPVSSVIFLVDGRHVAILCKEDSKIQLWSTDNGRLEKIQQSQMEHDAAVRVIAASNNGKWIVSGNVAGVVVIWNATTHPIPRMGEFEVAKGAKSEITALDISPDSSRIAIGSADGTMVVWSVERRAHILGPLQSSNVSKSLAPVSSMKFSPAGGRIASSHLETGNGNPSIQLWNSRTGTWLVSIGSPHSTYSLAWSVSSHRLFAGGSGGSIRYFDVETQDSSECRGPSFRDHISSLCVSNSGQLLVSVSSGRTNAIDVWNIRRVPPSPGESLHPHNDTRMAFASPDDARLITVRDNDIVLWCFPTPKATTEQSSDGQTTLVAYITQGIAYHEQGKYEEARNAFQFVLSHCESNIKESVESESNIKKLAESVKSVTMLECPNTAHRQTSIDSHLLDDSLCTLLKLFLLVRDCHMGKKVCGDVLDALKAGSDLGRFLHLPEAKTISLIFNRSLHSPISDLHELRCRALYEAGQSPHSEPASYFPVRGTDLSEELEAIQTRCSLLSEGFGDDAMRNQKYNEAIAWYSEALVLGGCSSNIVNGDLTTSEGAGEAASIPAKDWVVPWHMFSRCRQCIAHLLTKRSEVKAKMASWKEAMTDAKWATKIDPSFPWGYERIFVALHSQKRFEDAVSTLKDMSSRFMDTHIHEIRLLYKYSETLKEIKEQITAFFDRSPFVLIHVEQGHLYDQEERKSMFQTDPSYYELVSSMSTPLDEPDKEHIEKVVKKYFCYVMFSHTWEGEEPTFEQVTSKDSVYDLDVSSQNHKLRRFCETVRDHYEPRWSWSDTCCINKKDSDIYQKSIRFMYKWYRHSELTLVLLAHPSMSEKTNSTLLEHNRWIFRAWTLQELLAPKDIRFYNRNWELYLGGCYSNHKTSPKIREVLQSAMNDVDITLDDFSLDTLTVRDKLRLASTREATVKVDIAYSLVGIFNSDIHVEYTREGEVALGLLLQEIVNRQGETTVLDWIGTPSTFNSALPSDISVYKDDAYKPYKLPSIGNDMVDQRVKALDDAPSLKEDIFSFYDLLSTLGLPRFSDRRLSLPCITFPVDDIELADEASLTHRISTGALGEVQFKTQCTRLSKPKKGRAVLIYPWIRDLLAQIRHREGSKHTRALRLIPYLEKGFRALLFVEQSDQQYRRVATDGEILVGEHTLESLEDVSVEVLGIWEKS